MASSEPVAIEEKYFSRIDGKTTEYVTRVWKKSCSSWDLHLPLLQENQCHVFIFHANGDCELARLLNLGLHLLGIRCFKEREEVIHGEDESKDVENCFCMICLISKFFDRNDVEYFDWLQAKLKGRNVGMIPVFYGCLDSGGAEGAGFEGQMVPDDVASYVSQEGYLNLEDDQFWENFLKKLSVSIVAMHMERQHNLVSRNSGSRSLRRSITRQVHFRLGGHQSFTVGGENCGSAIIMSNVNYKNVSRRRHGAENDITILQKLLPDLGFTVREIWRDRSSHTMEYQLLEYATKDLSNERCFFCCIMSHGDVGRVDGTDDEPVKYIEIINDIAANETLADKPKVFLIDACMDGTDDDVAQNALAMSAPSKSPLVPSRPDVLMIYSTSPGHTSFHNPDGVSFFFQFFDEVLRTSPKRDLASIMSQVGKKVQEKTLRLHGKPQTPLHFWTGWRKWDFSLCTHME